MSKQWVKVQLANEHYKSEYGRRGIVCADAVCTDEGVPLGVGESRARMKNEWNALRVERMILFLLGRDESAVGLVSQE